MAVNSVNPEFVERYQLELNRNPRSRVFAPLSEAYRKMGLLDEARRVCRFGCQANVDFAGGHVAYAKVLLDLKQNEEALSHLESAAKLSPDNLLAHTLMGETLIELRRPKEALKAFKMVLFLDPENARATQAVRKWEFLTADEYSDEVFAMKPLFQKKQTAEDDELEELLTQSGAKSGANSTAPARDTRLEFQQRHQRALERAVSLADAFTIRNDLEAALKVLEDAKRLLGPMNEIETRARLLKKRLEVFSEPEGSETDHDDDGNNDAGRDGDREDLRPPLVMTDVGPDEIDPVSLVSKRDVLEQLLRRINDRRDSG